MAERVCVTGASGYIATHIVQQLLEAGYHVRGTVRDPSNEAKTKVLMAIAEKAQAADRLELVKADLLDEGSFDEAVKGCKYVLHTASPFQLQARGSPEEYFVIPAVKGTENVLNAVAKADSVERVVLTSSCAAVEGYADDKDTPFTEDDWNRTSTLSDGAYSLSKRRAEEAAWKMAEQQDKYTLVTINPAFVMGPTLTGRNDTASVEFLKVRLVVGVDGVDTHCLVDVRDVALAHIKAMTSPKAQGRYICSAKSMSVLEIAAAISAKYPNYRVPTRKVPKFLLYLFGPFQGLSWSFISHNVGVPLEFDNSKIKRDLDFEFRDVDTSLVEMVDSMVQHGLIPDRR
ncbi:hypothetical protein PTSG_12676 [Salpingoeca rosetta]|uniref:NAD-dependent epimerase/dehydratase domain-containing protein n=1 Tax=Salpingoeca rosetta (strain ATCC 50818 / BSB-021) TaxID=946362 RepID=F2UHW3_SALR5|nr:uncharacterized protein PTSG_12676 [Salpingoeca rosetta]EGD76712.1 hypothetical protein PTSG_12676 [Salpingoeca rosetta]|eukprot:XP_004991084.1 hypothetical protein PTSG_12676 [Salpingoeca rosetta]